MDNSTIRSWSDILPDLLSAIANYITRYQNYLDIRSFRSVCHSWRTSCPPLSRLSILSPFLPLSVAHPFPPLLTPSRRFSADSILSVTVVYVLRQTPFSELLPFRWILFVDEYETGKLKIRVPFSIDSQWWSIFSPKSVNLFDFHVHELGRFYNLSYPYYYDHTRSTYLTKPLFRSDDVLKVVLFPNGSAAVALFQRGKLGLIKLQCGDYEEQWEVLHDGKGFRFDDIVDCKGRVLGVDRRGRLYEINHSPSKKTPIVRSIADGDGRRNRLVVSLGRLYLVVKCDVSAIFKVYRFYEERRKWVKINSIGARVFFFGLDFSFSASSRKIFFHYNCILFKQHSFRSYKGEVDDKDVFCNYMRHDLYVALCNLKEATLVSTGEISPGLPHTLWPPPAWFWPTNRLERMKTVDATMDELLARLSKSLETKFQDPTGEGIGASYDVSWLQTCLLMQKHILDYKAEGVLDRAKQFEHELEALSIDWLEQMERLRVHTETGSIMIEEFRRAFENSSCKSLQAWVWSAISRQDLLILEDESIISDMVKVYNLLRIGNPMRINEMGQIEAVDSFPTD